MVQLFDEVTTVELPELLTTAQVARVSGYTREGVLRNARSGQLKPFAKLPGTLGAYLFARADVDAWLPTATRGGWRL